MHSIATIKHPRRILDEDIRLQESSLNIFEYFPTRQKLIKSVILQKHNSWNNFNYSSPPPSVGLWYLPWNLKTYFSFLLFWSIVVISRTKIYLYQQYLLDYRHKERAEKLNVCVGLKINIFSFLVSTFMILI